MDDNKRWRAFMRDLLGKAGIVIECMDGAEAVQAFATEKPQWVFMDVSMDKMDGFEAASRIKRQHGDARITFVTQHSEKEYLDKASKLGAELILKDEIHLFREHLQNGSFVNGAKFKPAPQT